MDRKEISEKSYKTEELDSLTGIYNRAAFYRRTEEMLMQSREQEYDLICIDIDRFKILNDLYGEEEGDKVLCYLADYLIKNVHESRGVCGRLDADHFAVCIPYYAGYENVLMDVTQVYMDTYPLDMKIVLSFGIYKIDERDVPVNIMCDRANLALKSIKGNYNLSYAVYTKKHRDRLLEEQMMINQMHVALEQHQFCVYLQPKFQFSTNRLIGAEALARWNHPEKGMISPERFIPVFEKNGFITALDEYIWEEVCRILKEWRDAGYPSIPVSINVSRVDIYNPYLISVLKKLLHQYKVPPNLLELEITESAYTENPEQLIRVVSELKACGFVVLMDDFGSGYSSLNMLNEVPVDVLKLDMKFLTMTHNSGRGGNILSSIIGMAKWLRMSVVAEGVETREQVDFLRSVGCDRGQGAYYSMPVMVDQFARDFLRKSTSQNEEPPLLAYYMDMEEFWNPDSPVNILFNCFVGGLAVLEMRGDRVSLMRTNDRYHEITMTEKGEFIDDADDFLESILPGDRETFLRMLEEAKACRGEAASDSRWFAGDGRKIIWVHMRVRVIACEEDRAVYLGSLEDITEQKVRERRTVLEQEEKELALYHASIHDALTGVLNRSAFEEETIHALARMDRGEIGAFLILDIDNFKEINDTLGHLYGDQVLVELTRDIWRLYSETTLVGRLGGDEFVMLMTSVPSVHYLMATGNQMCRLFSRTLEGQVPMSVSIGIAAFRPEHMDFRRLYQLADEALYEAKHRGKNQYALRKCSKEVKET